MLVSFAKNFAAAAAAAAAMMMIASSPQPVDAFDYAIMSGDDTGLVMTDNTTGITDLLTVFTNDVTLVEMTGVAWEYTGNDSTDTIVTWSLLLNGELVETGEVDISDTQRELPTSFECGSFQPSKSKSVFANRMIKKKKKERKKKGFWLNGNKNKITLQVAVLSSLTLNCIFFHVCSTTSDCPTSFPTCFLFFDFAIRCSH